MCCEWRCEVKYYFALAQKPHTSTPRTGRHRVPVQIFSSCRGGAEARARRRGQRPGASWSNQEEAPGRRQGHADGSAKPRLLRSPVDLQARTHISMPTKHTMQPRIPRTPAHTHTTQAGRVPWAPSMPMHSRRSLTRRRDPTVDCAVRPALRHLPLRSQARAPSIRGPPAWLPQAQQSRKRRVEPSLAHGPASRMRELQRAAPPSPPAPCTVCTARGQKARVRC